MIKEDEELMTKKKAHISYKKYKQSLESNPNEGLILFVSAFFVMLLIFLGVVKQISPEIDVSIGDNGETVSEEEFEKGTVDDRLRAIQMEDNSYSNDDTFSPELEEKVILPRQKHKTVGELEAENNAEIITLKKPETNKEITKPEEKSAAPVETKSAETKPATQPVTNAKVIVGYYATAEQAEVAKSIIQDAGLNIQPFVKNIGGAYTLQVGSFSSKEKAQGVANDLLKNNFPARVIVE